MGAHPAAAADKAGIRVWVRERLTTIAQQTLVAIGQCVSQRLLALPVVRQASVLAAYAAMADEIPIEEVVEEKLRQGGKVVMPRYDAAARCYRMVAIADPEKDLARGHYGVREPRPELPPEDLADLRGMDTVWLVPGLAFDPQGHRLGRGAGYYDRLLAGVVGPRIGVAQDWQILPSVPAEPHDAILTMVVSENRMFQSPQVPSAPQSRKENPCPISPNCHPSNPVSACPSQGRRSAGPSSR
jgi:5-formyltetrahydrofolate cyclo-ligase